MVVIRRTKLQKDINKIYKALIGKVVLNISMPLEYNMDEVLPSFTPFLIEGSLDSTDQIFVDIEYGDLQIKISEDQMLSDVNSDWGENFKVFETEDKFVVRSARVGEGVIISMVSDKYFRNSRIFVPIGVNLKSFPLTWFLMVAFGQGCLQYDTVLIHASVIDKDDLGYAFLGKSGTGKTTHSKLWLANLQGCSLLNDDNPAIYKNSTNQIMICGTPWSGKTPCYVSKSVPLKAIVRLEQSDVNNFEKVSNSSALITLIPSCTAIRWNDEVFDKMITFGEHIVSKVHIGKLRCLPNREAALECYNNIKN